MRNRGMSRATFLLATFFVVAVFFAVPSYLLYRRIETIAVDNLGQSAMRYAQTVARLIEQDLDPYKALYEEALESDPVYDEVYYQSMLEVFQTIVADLDATFVYTTRIIDEQSFVYVLDGENPESDLFSPYGSEDATTPVEWRVSQTGVPEYTGLLSFERWGTFLSGYAPIVDPTTGDLYGIVGVDYSLDQVNRLLDTAFWTMFIGVSLLVIFATGVLHKLLESRFLALETDYLTGLSSKQSYERFLTKTLNDAVKNKKSLSLMMIDVDDFKQINDIYGHDFGDMVLKKIGEALRETLHKGESVGRYGGDEFVFVLPGITAEQAAKRAEMILSIIRRLDIRGDDRKLPLTLSIGVAGLEGLEEPDKLMIAADRAMYLSKSKGKNRVSVYIE